VRGRWVALGAYTAAIYATLPFGPQLGRAFVRTGVGGWLLGPGLVVVVLLGVASTLGALVWRRAPRWAYAALGGAALGYGAALFWLRAQHLERIHLPEYGIAGWLAWRAVRPLCGDGAAYAAAALLAAAIGWGDELLQAVTPGRVYDLRDVLANAIGAGLGVLVIAALRARGSARRGVTAGSSSRRSPRAAGSSPR